MLRYEKAEPSFLKYSALPKRPKLVWPGNKPVALSVFLHFEHWELAGDGFYDPRFGELHPNQKVGRMPDYLTHSWFQYGNRVGIFRVLDALDRFPVKVTVAANSRACEVCPQLVERFLDRGYEIAAHGTEANRIISSNMSEQEESDLIRKSLDVVGAAARRRPIGWIGQGYGETDRTPALLERFGLQYVVDWSNDEQPQKMEVGAGLLSIPNQNEFDDVELFYHRKMLAWLYPDIIQRAFDQLRTDGALSGRFLGLHIHPWVFGKPHLIGYLEQTLTTLAQSNDVWHATGEDVANFVGR